MTSMVAQVHRLVALGYPKRLGTTVEAFEAALRPLGAHAPREWADVGIDDGVFAFRLPDRPVPHDRAFQQTARAVS